MYYDSLPATQILHTLSLISHRSYFSLEADWYSWDFKITLPTYYTLYKLWRKKIYQKLTSIWYQLFVIVQKIQPFPETRFLGLNNVTADYYYFQFFFFNFFAHFFPRDPLSGLNDETADYLWHWGHLSPQLSYWCISVTVFLTICLFVIFGKFYPRLLVLNDVTRDYLWHPATLALSALTYFINMSFFHIFHFLFSYLSTSIYHVFHTWPMWQWQMANGNAHFWPSASSEKVLGGEIHENLIFSVILKSTMYIFFYKSISADN